MKGCQGMSKGTGGLHRALCTWEEGQGTAFHSQEVVLHLCTRNPSLCNKPSVAYFGTTHKHKSTLLHPSFTCNWSRWCADKLFIASQLCQG